ncbi:phosphoribosyltransferase-like protein [Tricharina praecox]|uniref:phosphoribosyltransferase-like protein n=1 Tax=Tricharina praecox TaxID=43433 RepID=UPI00221F3539|nr:phosphoribosyltransferase-like protein [Tricharina praecox]KAI5857202.1 phosphoribosyltransferase-like protein [Tricharina praecox]
MSLPSHKTLLLNTSIEHRILRFGTFTLKSGRTSPYFFQAGGFNTASLLSTLSSAYARTIARSGVDFDVVFGPAYKGIPLAATTATALFALDAEAYGGVGYAFNRKEVKDHGEGGMIVGAELKGMRVLVVDDVITAGTAIREAVGIIEKAGGTVVGIVVALDRQERLNEEEGESAIMSVRRELGVPVVPILTLGDLIEGVEGEQREAMVAYRARYGAAEE